MRTMIGNGWRAACARTLTLVALCCFLAAPSAQAFAGDVATSPAESAAASSDSGSCASGEAIVCISAGFEKQLVGVADAAEALLSVDGESSGAEKCRLMLVKSCSLSTEELVAALEARDGVLFAEPNYQAEPRAGRTGGSRADAASAASGAQAGDLQAGGAAQPGAQAAATARPDYTGRQYAFTGTFGIGVPGWNTYDANGNPTPPVSTKGKVVAVLDEGVDYDHEDLRNVMWDEGTRYPSLVALGGGAYGINVAQPRGGSAPYDTTDPMDDNFHGTHVAGIIAGEWNGFGISGATSGAKIMAVKVMNDEGVMGISEALRAYRYVIAAQKAGVDVAAINNSWGDTVYSKALDLAVREAGRLGAVTAFAAGNDRSDIDLIEQVNGAFSNNPYVVVVGNSNEQGQMSESTNYGHRTVDVFAPGEKIYSTYPTGMGPGDDAAGALVSGGVTYSCDYEQEAVQGNADTGAFAFAGTNDTQLSIDDPGHDSARSLCMRTAQGGTSFSVSSKALGAGSECRGLCLWVKAPAAKGMSLMLTYPQTNGGSAEWHVELREQSAEWQLVTFPVDSLAVKDGLALTLSVLVMEWQDASDASVLVDDVKLVGETTPYEYETGTSMASPAVAGAATVLAAAFPDDDAAKRAARITGSVMPVESLANACVSGGIFRLDKALERDTAPVLNDATTAGDALTVSGYFFGAAAGSLAIDGQELQVTAWSDSSITAQLPDGFSPGDKLVQVTTSEGKTAHQRFRIGTPSQLCRRLPLPGRSLSGTPGEYAVVSTEFDESFYSAMPRGLVGLGGSLYYLMETYAGETTIFRYDIEGKTWEHVYEGGYAAGGGACTWNGKIVFVAGDGPRNKTYLGLFDPETRTAEYTPYNDAGFERACALVNTGKGILLAGGEGVVHGKSRGFVIEGVRMVNPETMTVSKVALPEDVTLQNSWYATAYDEEGSGYFFCGTNMNGLYKFSFADGSATCTVLEGGSVFDGPAEPAQQASSGDAGALAAQAGPAAGGDGKVADSQTPRMAAGPTKAGIIGAGPVLVGEANEVLADSFMLEWGQTKFKPTDGLVSLTKTYNTLGTAYRGNFYVIAASESEAGGWVFAEREVETILQPGDVDPEPTPTPGPTAESAPVSPASPASQPTSGEPAPAPASAPAPQSASKSSPLPSSGDPLASAAACLLAASVAALIIVHRSRRRARR